MKESIGVSLTDQLKEDYLSYSMAVLIGRSIPDMYDGLKPAQRRILQTMLEEGLMPDKRYVKCARVTGLTMGYYHPHSGAYGSLVNMATTWNNNVPWIDGHGNFGSTVDSPAAERYTECKLRQSAVDILLQDREIWETKDNYDGSRREAVRFNSAVPSVLLNGDAGIAVGFATKLAPHGLRSVTEAVKLLCKVEKTQKATLENRRKAREALVPDFPTGCSIVQDESLEEYRKTGSGGIRCIAFCEEGVFKTEKKGRERKTLTFTKLPPAVNPERIGDQIKNELEKGRITGVAEVNDLSDLSGDRVEVVAKPNTDIALLRKQLYSYTDLDTKYSAKTLVIDGTVPVELSPVDLVERWISWRLSCLRKRFLHELGIREARLHIVEGLVKAIDVLDKVIKQIRSSKDKKEAMAALTGKQFGFSEKQAEAILEMRLRQLTGLDQSDLLSEKELLLKRKAELEDLSKEGEEGERNRRNFMVSEVDTLGKRHGEARRSVLIAESSDTEKFDKTGPLKPKVSAASEKPRFMKVDAKKGTVEQVKGPRGAMVLEKTDKVILMTEDGMLKKVPSNFKGTISSTYSPVVLSKRELEVSKRKYLVVFTLEDQVKALTIAGEDFCKATSKGKSWLPEGANLLYFGEDSFTVNWVSKRKKPTKYDLTVKQGKPGGKGVKLANVADVVLSST